MPEPNEVQPQEVYLSPTSCCAIALLHAGNTSLKEDMEAVIKMVKKQQERDWFKKGKQGGWTTLLAVAVMPYEEELSRKLQEVGFSSILNLKRRNGYPPGYNLLHVLLVGGEVE